VVFYDTRLPPAFTRPARACSTKSERLFAKIHDATAFVAGHYENVKLENGHHELSDESQPPLQAVCMDGDADAI